MAVLIAVRVVHAGRQTLTLDQMSQKERRKCALIFRSVEAQRRHCPGGLSDPGAHGGGSIGSAFLPYYDFTQAGAMRWIVETAKGWVGRSQVPTGIALFAKDSTHAPREWAERFFDVQRYTELPRGGHFAAFEEPELLAQELRAFFKPLRGN